MKRILIAPLDWGLGHATRCIPVIRYLLEKKCEVVIGADGRPLDLLKKEFSSCEFVQMNGYDISYPKSGSMALKIAAQIPKILSGIKKEHELLKKIIKEKKIDAVISDNRFGLWSDDIPCVFMTHQLMIKSPFGEKWIHELNKKYISKYAECWVPDVQSTVNLSGDLSHKFPLPENAKFMGVLSRFERDKFFPPQRNTDYYDVMAIVSGTEPQRTIFEQLISKQFNETKLKTFLVAGKTEVYHGQKIANNKYKSHLSSDKMQRQIFNSSIIVSRPGYSTVMDLAMLGKKAIFVPTPGQTEQEYLAKYFMENNIAFSMTQNKFDLNVALKESEKYSGFTEKYSGEEFKKAVDSFILSLK